MEKDKRKALRNKHIFNLAFAICLFVLECGSFKKSKATIVNARFTGVTCVFDGPLPQPQYEQVIARIFVVEGRNRGHSKP